MQFPNYFLADLPPDTALTPHLIEEACRTLKDNQRRFLAQRTAAQLIESLAELGRHWQDPLDPIRTFALEQGPQRTGFSRATLERGIGDFFKELTPKNLRALIMQDLGHSQRADLLCSSEVEQSAERASLARGPELILHITGGALPNPAWASMVLGLLAKSAQFVKCSSRGAFLPRLFAHSLYALDPKLGACLEVAEWKGGNDALEAPLFAQADLVAATGSDETLEKIRRKLPPGRRFIGYGHRLSFGYIGRQALDPNRAAETIRGAAQDVAAWNQLGCLSPHLFYVEVGSATSAAQFAQSLAHELERLESTQPRGPISVQESAAIAARRDFYRLRAAHHDGATQLWASADSTAWTVVYEEEPLFQISCLNRFVYVKETADLAAALRAAEAVRGKVSTVGLAAPPDVAPALAARLAQWGAARICRLGQMQQPPLAWRHDGRPALADLFTWADWEF